MHHVDCFVHCVDVCIAYHGSSFVVSMLFHFLYTTDYVVFHMMWHCTYVTHSGFL